MVEIHGDVEPRFARVRDAFARNFERDGKVGAAVTVHHRGRVDAVYARSRSG